MSGGSTMDNFVNVNIAKLTSFRGVKVDGTGPSIRVPGIGDISADALEEAGIMTPLQLLGQYLALADEDAFVQWATELGCIEWRLRDPTKGTVVALRQICEKLFS
ncbi:uncharacterized protein AMSG_04225 [Thecamonas trahens ATCC 50062]|uniref:Uncharacterized protein n=1 Tax=Thecamonas trahens ATCC 50062 TaxID=461836 RepID=A0A0L0D702_THETB|nr:hypothetical protein AMSG_04225 [Thecamonas trahens ATCC 50062]KNC47990.1 hypothetical protein AMSG_04225 [Thecamonas trahens ATCC 50062]|eukprot:XP_013759007.1 hypothetical protein AMSG_04225 [Thecamonas trahens ATCC 50062]